MNDSGSMANAFMGRPSTGLRNRLIPRNRMIAVQPLHGAGKSTGSACAWRALDRIAGPAAACPAGGPPAHTLTAGGRGPMRPPGAPCAVSALDRFGMPHFGVRRNAQFHFALEAQAAFH